MTGVTRLLGIVTVVAALSAGGPPRPGAPDRPAVQLASGSDVSVALGSGDALIMGPSGISTPSPTYLDTVQQLYLEPLGFTGRAIALTTPELRHHTDTSVGGGVTSLVDAVNSEIAGGRVSADYPLVIFGYSQSTAVAALAMEELHRQGVPTDDLHFVLVGNSASAYGGILNALLPSLSDELAGVVRSLLGCFDLRQTMDLTTPGYYPTDVYTITTDGYADWPQNFLASAQDDIKAILGFAIQHNEYLGLTTAQIQAAALTNTDGLVDYYTIDNAAIPVVPTLLNAAIGSGILPAFADGMALKLAELFSNPA